MVKNFSHAGKCQVTQYITSENLFMPIHQFNSTNLTFHFCFNLELLTFFNGMESNICLLSFLTLLDST